MTVSNEPLRFKRSPQDLCELAIVMPCLNEVETVEICVRKAIRWIQQAGVDGEVIVADNGSTDGSQELAEAAGARVVSIKDKGYGSALMGGIAAARGKYVIMGDADDSYDFSRLEVILAKLRDNYDLVMGNRFLGGIKTGAMRPLHRYLGNPILTAVGRLFFPSPCRDFHCGLRGFTREAFARLDLRTTGMEFASEMVVKATLLRMRVTEVPVTLSPDGRSRPPHLRSWRDGWRHLRFLLLYSPRWLFLVPGFTLIVLGGALSILLEFGPSGIGRVTFDVQTLLYAAFSVVIGVQCVQFACFTKIFAISEGLLPADPTLDKLYKFFTLEAGLAVGAFLIFVGIGGTLWGLEWWRSKGFGPLQPSYTLRVLIPAVTSLALGFQTVFASFFLSVLGLRRR
jgi:glycosyltransferase involved in cell wall biosynthesis